ncbi:MAG: N-acetyltransferase [Proteobacteria bacterium]|nr:N-acetyltransferase [Pseudomonadota bacterium]
MELRKAIVKDAKAIHQLLLEGSKNGELLPRSLNEIYDNIRDFFVLYEDGELVGVSALHICWEDLAEVRSLMVRNDMRDRGFGSILLNSCLEEAKKMGIKRIFALTYKVNFFKKHGFREIDKRELPHKIWSDCIKCSKFPDCDEEAVIIEFKD